MNLNFSIICLLLLTSYCGQKASLYAEKLTLEKIYKLAVERSENLQSQNESIKQAEERLVQAQANYFPTINASLVYQRQPELTTDPLVNRFAPAEQTTAKISLNQSIFKGFKDLYTKQQREIQLEGQEVQKNLLRWQLLKELITPFFQKTSLQQELILLNVEINLLKQRVQELKKILQGGRNKETEILNLESNLYTLEATKASLQGLLEVQNAQLEFLTGVSNTTNEELPQLEVNLSKDQDDLTTALAHINLRPDILLAQKELAAAEKAAQASWGNHMPTLDVTGNYYPTRPGLLQDIHWDVQVIAQIPIFSGGNSESLRRQLLSEKAVKRIQLERLNRLAEQEIKSTYFLYQADLKQMIQFQKSLEKLESILKIQEKERHTGVSTHLDILQTTSNLTQARKYLAKLVQQKNLDLTKFLIASNHLPFKL